MREKTVRERVAERERECGGRQRVACIFVS